MSAHRQPTPSLYDNTPIRHKLRLPGETAALQARHLSLYPHDKMLAAPRCGNKMAMPVDALFLDEFHERPHSHDSGAANMFSPKGTTLS